MKAVAEKSVAAFFLRARGAVLSMFFGWPVLSLAALNRWLPTIFPPFRVRAVLLTASLSAFFVAEFRRCTVSVS